MGLCVIYLRCLKAFTVMSTIVAYYVFLSEEENV